MVFLLLPCANSGLSYVLVSMTSDFSELSKSTLVTSICEEDKPLVNLALQLFGEYLVSSNQV